MRRPLASKQDVLAALLVLAGVAVLGHTFLRTDAAAPSPAVAASPLGQWTALDVDLEELLAPESFRFPLESGPILAPRHPGEPAPRLVALFVLHAKVCPPCLEELSQYAEMLEIASWDDADLPVRPVGLVVEEDDELAERFILTTPLPLAVGHGHPEGLSDLLVRYGSRRLVQQIAFVDVEQQTLFYRTGLSNAVSSRDHKERVLDDMWAAYRAVAP